MKRTDLPSLSEAEFTTMVIQLAKLKGWLVCHFRAARTAHGWRTPVQGDGAGFVDLILVRGDRLIAAELKSDTGRVAAEQQQWLDALAGAGQTVAVWRPAQWEHIAEVLE